MELIPFIAGAMALLAVPGPTNTLLATAGAAVGLRKAVRLLAAELGGYILAILLMRAVLGRLVVAAPALGAGLRAAVVLYLLYLAVKLWRHGSNKQGDAPPVTFGRVFTTTLLNPKALIFAFTLLPPEKDFVALWPWLVALALQIVTVGFGWISLGAALSQGLKGRVQAKFGYRIGAIVLAVFAGIIIRLA
jgi:threonine/homoserine/homoserine lactone efflux protein